jgi:hypothetical protein
MKHWKGLTYCFIVSLLSVLLCGNAASQGQKAPSPPAEPPATAPPEHPITEEQLRTFFKVMHVFSSNRQLVNEELELQQKQLPEWYPEFIWDEIRHSIENIDLPALALPVYQKYLSEDDAKFLINFMSSPPAQEIVQALLARDTQAALGGKDPARGHDQAVMELFRSERAEIDLVLSSMSPKESRELASKAGHFEEMQPALRQMREEFGQTVIAKQAELAKAIAAGHRAELVDAKRSYEASHPETPKSQTPK